MVSEIANIFGQVVSVRFVVFNASFNNITVIWWSVFFRKETRVPGENRRSAASH